MLPSIASRRGAPVLLAFVLLLPGRLDAAAAKTVSLTVLHTSDLHGRVHPRDSLADRDFGDGLARVAAIVRRARAEGRPTLLLDSGDAIQGSPEQALAARDGSADPVIAAMNAAGYDAMAVGNHEFDFGRERLEASRAQARFPFLSANVLAGDRPAFAPYVVRVVGGVRVGILGLTTPTVGDWESPAHVRGLRFEDARAAAARYVPILRGKERCDLVLVVAHLGFERDLETGAPRGEGTENEAYAIATEVPGIDILLTGHTHTVIAPRRLGPTWVSQPGRFGAAVTRFDVVLSRAGGRWAVAEIRGATVEAKGADPDPDLVRVAEPAHAKAMAELARPVARLAEPLSARLARTADTALLDWLHAVERERGAADVSFASLLPGALPDWPAGPLTVRQVWAFYPYENTLVTVSATGAQIRGALEEAARCVSGVEIVRDGPAWRRNPAVWGYNCDTLDGADYALDPARPEGGRLLYLKRDGKPVGDADVLRVALNSYRAAGGGGYAVWKTCPRLSETRSTLRELLIEDASRRKDLAPKANGNWFLAPSFPEAPFRPSGGS